MNGEDFFLILLHFYQFLKQAISLYRYIKFDTFTPAAENGLPVTRVISRMTLQEILAKAVGADIIKNGQTVVDFEDTGSQVCIAGTFQNAVVLSDSFPVAISGYSHSPGWHKAHGRYPYWS